MLFLIRVIGFNAQGFRFLVEEIFEGGSKATHIASLKETTIGEGAWVDSYEVVEAVKL